MGKAKKVSRSSLARVSAIRRRQDNYSPKAATTPDNAVPLIAKLSSLDPKDRAMAVTAIANVIEISSIRKALLKEKLVQTIMDRSLTDSSEEVVMEAFGILRNLALEEGYDVCVFLWRKDVLVNIEVALEKVQTALKSPVSPTSQQKALVYRLLENLLSLLTLLGASSDDIRDSITARFSELPGFALSLISSDTTPDAVKVTAAETIYVLSEENNDYIDKIVSLGFTAPGNLSIPLKIYLSGIEYNILEVSSTASIDILDIVQSIVISLKEIDVRKLTLETEADVDGPVKLPIENAQFQSNQDLLTAAQVGLAILTAIAEALVVGREFNGREEIKDDISDDAEGDDDVGMLDAGADNGRSIIEDAMDLVQDVDDDERQTPVVSFFLKEGLPTVLPLVQSVELRSHALHALNNILWTLNSLSPGWANSFDLSIWKDTLKLLQSTSDLDCKIGCVGILWAWSKDCSKKITLAVDVETVRWLITAYQQFNDQAGVEYKVRIIGLLGVIAAAHTDVNITKEISIFILTQILALPNTPPEVVIEALNAIYDIFADKEYSYDYEIFVKGDFLKHLVTSQSQVKRMAKSIDKRKHFQLRERADEVVINLQRFIVYKAKERR